MNAFGGRGIWLSAFFLPWPGRRGEETPTVEGNKDGSVSGSGVEQGSVNVPGVIVGANAMCCGIAGSTGAVQVSRIPRAGISSVYKHGESSRTIPSPSSFLAPRFRSAGMLK